MKLNIRKDDVTQEEIDRFFEVLDVILNTIFLFLVASFVIIISMVLVTSKI